MRQFGHRPRHVIVRRHDDQRLETAILGPAARFGGVGDGVDRSTIEVDAAGDDLAVLRLEPRDLALAGQRVDAGDQQPLPVAFGQQFDGILDPRRAAREHDDTVGLAHSRTISLAGTLVRNHRKPATSATSASSAMALNHQRQRAVRA